MKTKQPIKSTEPRRAALQGRVSKPEPKPSDDAKRKLVEIWLAFDGNEARAILEAFQLGFKDGVNCKQGSRTRQGDTRDG